MLRSLNELTSFTIGARDGEIGKVHDFIFDEREWTIRYVVIDTGKWLPGRKVLVSPAAIESVEWKKGILNVDLEKEQVRSSPVLDKALPLSPRDEEEMVFYYSWPAYWAPPGQFRQPVMVSPTKVEDKVADTGPTGAATVKPPAREEEPHLRSVEQITGYSILANDGEIGHADGFLADDETWRIRYMVVDTRNWLPGKKVLIAPDWILAFIWEDSKVDVDLTREQIEKSPAFDPSVTLDREHEEELYNHYGRSKYWK